MDNSSQPSEHNVSEESMWLKQGSRHAVDAHRNAVPENPSISRSTWIQLHHCRASLQPVTKIGRERISNAQSIIRSHMVIAMSTRALIFQLQCRICVEPVLDLADCHWSVGDSFLSFGTWPQYRSRRHGNTQHYASNQRQL